MARILAPLLALALGAVAAPVKTPLCVNSKGCYNLAGPRAKAGKCAQAIALYSQSIKLDPTWPWSWYSRAVLKRALGDEKGALSDFNEAVKRNGDTPGFKKTALETPAERYGPGWTCKS